MNDAPAPGPDLAAFLSSVPLFAGASDLLVSALARACHTRTIRKGQILFSQSDPATAAYLVRSGSISILLTTADGRELLINEIRAGECFGELALLTQQPRSTDAVARQTSEVVILPREAFLSVLEAEPRVARRILETTARRLALSSERERALAFLGAEARLARVLLGLDRAANASGLVKISQEELAQRTGLARQTVAKALGQWRRAGWLVTGRGKVMLLNRAGLCQRAEETDGLSFESVRPVSRK